MMHVDAPHHNLTVSKSLTFHSISMLLISHLVSHTGAAFQCFLRGHENEFDSPNIKKYIELKSNQTSTQRTEIKLH